MVLEGHVSNDDDCNDSNDSDDSNVSNTSANTFDFRHRFSTGSCIQTDDHQTGPPTMPTWTPDGSSVLDANDSDLA